MHTDIEYLSSAIALLINGNTTHSVLTDRLTTIIRFKTNNDPVKYMMSKLDISLHSDETVNFTLKDLSDKLLIALLEVIINNEV